MRRQKLTDTSTLEVFKPISHVPLHPPDVEVRFVTCLCVLVKNILYRLCINAREMSMLRTMITLLSNGLHKMLTRSLPPQGAL